MRVLVTGGAGYIGSVVTADLAASGFDVTVLDKLIYGAESLLGLTALNGIRLVQGDVRARDVVADVMTGIDVVIHLAAIVGEPACSIDEKQARDINFHGTRVILDAAETARVKHFIYVSTCSNYGVSAPNVLADEDAPLKPLSMYAESKVESELLVLQKSDGIATTVLRLGTICGLSPRMRFDLLVSDMARCAALGRPIDIFAPDAWRPFLHVRDAARVLRACLGAPVEKIGGRVLNVVGENIQKVGLGQLVHRHFPNARVEVTSKLPDLRDYRVSADRIAGLLGFRPAFTVENALLETANAVANGVFRDPFWPGHSAVPTDASRLALVTATVAS